MDESISILYIYIYVFKKIIQWNKAKSKMFHVCRPFLFSFFQLFTLAKDLRYIFQFFQLIIQLLLCLVTKQSCV